MWPLTFSFKLSESWKFSGFSVEIFNTHWTCNIAQVLSNFFKSVYVNEGSGPLPEFKAQVKSKIRSIDVTEEDIKCALKSLNVNKSKGPDGIHPRVLKELADQIASPLCKIFNRSIKEGKIPDMWREAEVRPIFKKGKKNDPGNYRPVSLLLCYAMFWRAS